MLLCKVTGSVISTRKNERLQGCKFLVVQTPEGNNLIAIDQIGAGVGETVLVAQGSAARLAAPQIDIPVDAAVIGIIDE